MLPTVTSIVGIIPSSIPWLVVVDVGVGAGDGARCILLGLFPPGRQRRVAPLDVEGRELVARALLFPGLSIPSSLSETAAARRLSFLLLSLLSCPWRGFRFSLTLSMLCCVTRSIQRLIVLAEFLAAISLIVSHLLRASATALVLVVNSCIAGLRLLQKRKCFLPFQHGKLQLRLLGKISQSMRLGWLWTTARGSYWHV